MLKNSLNQLVIEFSDVRPNVLDFDKCNKKTERRHKWKHFKGGFICVKCSCQKSVVKTEKGYRTFYNSDSYFAPKCC